MTEKNYDSVFEDPYARKISQDGPIRHDYQSFYDLDKPEVVNEYPKPFDLRYGDPKAIAFDPRVEGERPYGLPKREKYSDYSQDANHYRDVN